MKKVITLEVIIVIVTLAIVLPLAFTAHSSYAGYQTINENNASRALTFNLKTGQTVTGSITYYGDTHGQWYLVVDPNNNEINSDVGSLGGEGNYGTFTFTANIDGEWYISMYEDSPFGHSIYYSYSVSSPPILGIDVTVLIAIVITIGGVLAVSVALFNLHLTRKQKQGKTQPTIQ